MKTLYTLLFLGLTLATIQTADAKSLDRIVAIVNYTVITQADLDN